VGQNHHGLPFMNQKTVKLIRKFVIRSIEEKNADKRKIVFKKLKKTYNAQNPQERAKVKSDMREALKYKSL